MPKIIPPVKPFQSYKWRWATFQPTESLNEPAVFLGVLRVFNRFNNYPAGSTEILEALSVVENETKTEVDLVRTTDRNLVRNSGQYWKALGLLDESHGRIQVSPFGRLLAEGKISKVEFAMTAIKTLELPNRRIVDDTKEWDLAGLTIKPLELILDILADLLKGHGNNEAYITPFELLKIIIPLAGAKAIINNYTEAIIQYRNGQVDLSGWPDCAPMDNDKRIVREFLLFLSNYGFCTVVQVGRRNESAKFFLSSISVDEIVDLRILKTNLISLDKIVTNIRETRIPANIERKKVTREILERPYQGLFRKNILAAFNSTCLLTGVSIDSVLEAAHIIPVNSKGSDRVENGLCLRSDVHQLFDTGHLRLLPNGGLILSELASADNNYKRLPRQVRLPEFVNKDYLDWRYKYC